MEDINKCYTLFFDSVTFNGELIIKVIEGKRSSTPENFVISGSNFVEAYKVKSDNTSETFTITFRDPVVWQIVNESFTLGDASEVVEVKGLLSILSKSKYLDYVEGSHGFYKDIIGPGKHYRIWTVDQVIDIISLEDPVVDR